MSAQCKNTEHSQKTNPCWQGCVFFFYFPTTQTQQVVYTQFLHMYCICTNNIHFVACDIVITTNPYHNLYWVHGPYSSPTKTTDLLWPRWAHTSWWTTPMATHCPPYPRNTLLVKELNVCDAFRLARVLVCNHLDLPYLAYFTKEILQLLWSDTRRQLHAHHSTVIPIFRGRLRVRWRHTAIRGENWRVEGGGGGGEERKRMKLLQILGRLPYGTRAATGDVGCGFRGDDSL